MMKHLLYNKSTFVYCELCLCSMHSFFCNILNTFECGYLALCIYSYNLYNYLWFTLCHTSAVQLPKILNKQFCASQFTRARSQQFPKVIYCQTEYNIMFMVWSFYVCRLAAGWLSTSECIHILYLYRDLTQSVSRSLTQMVMYLLDF